VSKRSAQRAEGERSAGARTSRRSAQRAEGERSAGARTSRRSAQRAGATAAQPGLAALVAGGAARGAAALAGLVGGEAGSGRLFTPTPRRLAARETGALFAIGGAVPGALAVLFAASSRRAIVRALGPAAAADSASALAEVANIVASQAVCAIAEGLGARVALSVPRWVERGAGTRVARARRPGGEVLASELRTDAAGPPVLLVVLPGAALPGCDTVGA
jgi:hypothetical protein